MEGHRGARGLVVEHTLASFDAALDAGVTGIELDVRLTADGQVVVWHDPVLSPEQCTSSSPELVGARVRDLTLEQLRTVDIGSRTLARFPGQRPSPGAHVCTLDEVLAHGLVRDPSVWWTVELKVDPRDAGEARSRRQLVEGVLQSVHDASVEHRCFVHSFDWAVLELSAGLAPDVLRSALVETGVTWVVGSPWTGSVRVGESHDDVCAGAVAVGAHVISPEHDLVDEAFVEHAHAAGLAVLPWTVNDADRMRDLVAAGVDGLVTDHPDRASAVLARTAD
ncbi:glycerophosphodiester phosphodiesterase family protein [Terrabacter aerolatus]|uniref:glycerophosphodiester phosphodiesterase family protein n=1 Tax=Terrabacter aerolatus TaxID=422442 RepID=UPI0031D375D0